MKPLVSILMNCYNGEEFLQETLDSVAAQTYQNYEIIFVDNCSTDKTAEMAKNFGERLKYHKTSELLPLYGARNFGLPFCKGEYLTVLDTDDIWHPKKLEFQMSTVLEKDLEFSFTGHTFLLESNSIAKKLVYFLFNCLIRLKSLFIKSEFYSLDRIAKKYPVNLQTIMIKRSAYADIEFNDKLSLIGDLDFFYRIFLHKKVTPYFIKNILVNVRVHPKQLSHVSVRKWLLEVRYVYLFFLRPYFTEKQKALFKQTIDVMKYQYSTSINDFEQAYKHIKDYKFLDLVLFYQTVKTYLKLKFSRN